MGSPDGSFWSLTVPSLVPGGRRFRKQDRAASPRSRRMPIPCLGRRRSPQRPRGRALARCRLRFRWRESRSGTGVRALTLSSTQSALIVEKHSALESARRQPENQQHPSDDNAQPDRA